jgi:hypothetical protein
VAGCCEHGNETSSFIKYGKIVYQLRNSQFLKKNCTRGGVRLINCRFPFEGETGNPVSIAEFSRGNI